MIQRTIKEAIMRTIKPGKVILVYGARRVGKTVLIKQIAEEFSGKTLFLNGEDSEVETMFLTRSASHYRQLFSGIDLLVVDEAQNIPDIGRILKLIVDEIENIRVIASGSSSFDLKNQTGEPLVGRSYTFHLSSLAISEWLSQMPVAQLYLSLEEKLIYGGYPELTSFTDFESKQHYLSELSEAYLLKDILTLDGIKNSSKMLNLLRLVAFQVGSEVSYDELSRQLCLSRNTVEKYLDLLSKTFVIFKLSAFSKNSRKEIRKSSKWYFYDNGIRNAVIGDFRPLALRQDAGALWENFMVSERIKLNNNHYRMASYYFWRTYNGQEVDLIEESNGVLRAFEFKWGDKEPKCPRALKENYPDISFEVISKSNFIQFTTTGSSEI